MKLKRSPSPPAALLFLVPALLLPLLLVFFVLLSSTFLLQPGVAVTLPDSPFMLSPQRDPRIITLAPPPSSAIFFENEQVDEATLKEKLSKIRGRSSTIIINADRRALYDRVTAVVSLALDLGFPVVLATAEESGMP